MSLSEPITITEKQQPIMNLTDTASAKVKELLLAEGNTELALRVAVRPGGCSGFSYDMFFDSEFAPDDNIDETEIGRAHV
jgi:iron-sulfur cluster assembly accessory protein